MYIFNRYDLDGALMNTEFISGTPSMITVLPGALSLETTIAYGSGIV